MKYQCILILLFSTWWECVHSILLNGPIVNDISFFHSKLSIQASKSATIEFWITLPKNFEYVNLYIYTTENHINVDKKCSYLSHGQVANDDLHQELSSERNSCQPGNEGLMCHKKLEIQDYISRDYSFSLEFYCKDRLRKSLKGLQYKIRMYAESNETSCTPMPYTITNCSQHYTQVSNHNLLSKNTAEEVAWKINKGRAPFLRLLDQNCYQHFDEWMCYLFLPKCDLENKTMVVPCKEGCQELEEACFLGLDLSTISVFRDKYDCDYLPSMYGPIPCFYKPVTCDLPPNVTNAEIVNEPDVNNT